MSAITIERLHPDAELPTRATEQSAGYDLRAYLRGRTVRCSDGVHEWTIGVGDGEGATLDLPPGAMALVPCGFRARLPDGYEAQIRPRSGAAFRRAIQIPNAPGTIDADYPDEWMVMIRNAAAAPLVVAHGERIAQMVLHRYEVLALDEGRVGTSTSRTGGFGSTGR